MPPRTPKACRVRGCRNTTTDPSATAKATKAKAGSNTSQDNPVISAVMVLSGMLSVCVCCNVTKACVSYVCVPVWRVKRKTVDHIIPKAHGGTDADSNLQSLCWPCHKAKTARERLK